MRPVGAGRAGGKCTRGQAERQARADPARLSDVVNRLTDNVRPPA